MMAWYIQEDARRAFTERGMLAAEPAYFPNMVNTNGARTVGGRPETQDRLKDIVCPIIMITSGSRGAPSTRAAGGR